VERNGDYSTAADILINPLLADSVHFLAEIPVEMSEHGRAFDIQVTVNGEKTLCRGYGPLGNSLLTINQGAKVEENTIWQEYNESTLDNPIEAAGYGRLTLKKAGLTQEIAPTSPNNNSTTFPAPSDDQVYLDTVFEFENLSGTAIEINDFLKATAIYDNKYEYNSFALIELSNGRDLAEADMSVINNQEKATIHFVFELPKESATRGLPLVLTFTLDHENYYYIIR
jgi:hypothetical protein